MSIASNLLAMASMSCQDNNPFPLDDRFFTLRLMLLKLDKASRAELG